MKKQKKLVFLCGARDFHAMDWYKSAKCYIKSNNLEIVTDLIESEGFTKLISEDDRIYKLLILDKILFNTPSRIGDLWRNFLKILFFPIQCFLLTLYKRKNPNSIFYAHSMYYLWLAYFTGLDFIGTPQGSDILIKPFKSSIYKYLSKKSLRAAKLVTVDSEIMKEKCFEISGVKAEVIQNGIDIDEILKIKTNVVKEKNKNRILSIRGITPLYRIEEILKARDSNCKYEGINFIYPFYDKQYMSNFVFSKNDLNFGRLNRKEMYEHIFDVDLVISIPSSDSSPRSVYESIFCNSVVGITYHKYYDQLPECMKKRILILDLTNSNWLYKALKKAKEIKIKDYMPSEKALNLFDQKRSFLKKLKLIDYNEI